MWVLALTGLLYLATATVRRWYVLGYGAVALLFAAWALWWRFFMNMSGVQWYAVPAGTYLLGVGWLEWRLGRKTLARWIDRVGGCLPGGAAAGGGGSAEGDVVGRQDDDTFRRSAERR